MGSKEDAYMFIGFHFPGDWNFSGIEFSQDVFFRKTTFQGKVYFSTTTFCGYANFSEVTFQDDTWFSDVDFQDSAIFFRTTFQGNAYFNKTTFKKGSFNEASFQDATFWKATFQDVEFKRAVFRNADFMGATFQDVYFNRTKFQYGNFNRAAFQDAYFGGAIIRDISFNEASFQDVDFHYTKVKEFFEFNPAKISGMLNFRNAKFFFSGSITTNLEKAKFHRAHLQNVAFINCKWPNDYIIYEEKHMNDKEITLSYNQLETIYRDLKQNMQNHGNYNIAGEFYYREMEMRRKGATKKKEHAGLLLYKYLAGYGENY